MVAQAHQDLVVPVVQESQDKDLLADWPMHRVVVALVVEVVVVVAQAALAATETKFNLVVTEEKAYH